MQLRIDKYLADAGIGTRKEVRELIKKKMVRVNGTVVKDIGLKVDSESDEIVCAGERVGYSQFHYYMMNKPDGVLTATEDRDRTVMDLMTGKKDRLFPVGRLDLDTEGLLLITDDGALAHDLLSPKKHVDKIYYAELDADIPAEAEEIFLAGIEFSDFTSAPAKLSRISARSAELTIHEGKFHQVKRMFAKVGCEVTYLKRLTMGTLRLDESLAPGEYRELTAEEISALQSCRKG